MNLYADIGACAMDSSEDVVLIIGAIRGLGRAFAQAFADRRARVAITARSADAWLRTVDDIGLARGWVLAPPADVTDPDAAPRVIAAAGRIIDVASEQPWALI